MHNDVNLLSETKDVEALEPRLLLNLLNWCILSYSGVYLIVLTLSASLQSDCVFNNLCISAITNLPPHWFCPVDAPLRLVGS